MRAPNFLNMLSRLQPLHRTEGFLSAKRPAPNGCRGLDPGETIDFHIHYHPYLVISLGGGENEIETIFGDRIKTVEELGSTAAPEVSNSADAIVFFVNSLCTRTGNFRSYNREVKHQNREKFRPPCPASCVVA
jgi:hypothetical protein